MHRYVRLWLLSIAVILIVAGMLSAYFGSHQLRWGLPPRPPAWEAAASGDGNVLVSTATPLRRSVPRLLWIPAIKVWAQIAPRGLTRDGGVGVPSLSTPFLTTWFDKGPAPGQRGTAAVFGHVDAHKVGPAVFYQLGLLHPGNLVYVTLQDGQVAIFRVYASAMYPKNAFPTALVYGYTHWPTLRLITCGGAFDPRTRHYLSNVVVYARYVGARHS
jgi:hypothetical protein